jgi:uncharacterized phage protein gp47/JayE
MSSLDENGLIIDRFPDILSDIESDQRTNISADLVYNDNTVIYQLNSIVASLVGNNAELLEAVYNAKRLSTATGIDLDYLGALKGIYRLPDSFSQTTFQQFVGDAGTLIAAGSLFSNPVTADQFTNPEQIVLSPTSCTQAILEVTTLLNTTLYSVTINDVVYSITSDVSATRQEIVDSLETEITSGGDATFTANSVGETLVLASVDDNPISVIVTTYMSVTNMTAFGSLTAVAPGRVVAPPNTVTNVVSTIPGLDSTTNTEQYTLGRLEETDDEYRIRIGEGEGSPCFGTPPSIEAYLLANVPNIGSATVIENATSTTDVEGRPPHSYEVIVTGGTNADVAEAVWTSHGAGIELFGNTSEVYVDPRGRAHTVNFSRPTPVNAAVRVTYTLYDEEVFPGNGELLITQAVVDHVNGLEGGQDIIVGRMFGSIYNSVAGLDSITVEIQELASPGDTPVGGSWTTTSIPVSDDEFASTTDVDISFVAP